MYYKLSYVNRQIGNPEQRICDDVPKLCSGLSQLLGDTVSAAIDATFYAWQLKSYAKTNRYTLGILAYVLGAGTATTVLAPNFKSLFRRSQSLEGTPCQSSVLA